MGWGNQGSKTPDALTWERGSCRLPLVWTQTSERDNPESRSPCPLATGKAVLNYSLTGKSAVISTLSDFPNILWFKAEMRFKLLIACPEPLWESSAVCWCRNAGRGLAGLGSVLLRQRCVTIKRDGLISSFGDLVACWYCLIIQITDRYPSLSGRIHLRAIIFFFFPLSLSRSLSLSFSEKKLFI